MLIHGYRIFLHSHLRPVPGYVIKSELGTVKLPLKLDGRMESVRTGYLSDNPGVLSAYLEQTIHRHSLPSFVNRTNRFLLYENKKTFKLIHRPRWIKRVAYGIMDTVNEYAAGEGRVVSKLTPYNLIENLKTACNRLIIYKSSLLYMGMFDEREIGVMPTSHELFCRPLENEMSARIRMMQWLFSIDHLFYRRLKPRINIEDDEGNRRVFKDPLMFDPIKITLTNNQGVEYTTILGSHERSTEVFFTGHDGNITAKNIYQPNGRFERMSLSVREIAYHIMDTYVLAELKISAKDILELSKGEGTPIERVYNFLVRERQVPRDLTSIFAQSVVNVITDIASNLRLSNHGKA